MAAWSAPRPARSATIGPPGSPEHVRPATPLPPPPLPAGSIRAHRRVHASGRIMVAKQAIKLDPRHAGNSSA
jgi:hypothetical protein